MRKTFILLLITCQVAVMSLASDFRAYKIIPGKGLNSNIVRDITQDRSGYLWLASIHGLYRYDGYTMKQVFTKEDIASGLIPDVRTISMHRWGNRFLWTRLRGDFFCCYDLHRNRFIRYTENNQSSSFTSGYFGCEDEAWLYDNKEGCRRITFNGQDLQVTDYRAKAGSDLPSSRIHFISQGSAGRIWIGTDRGLVLSRKGRLTAVGSKHLDVRELVMLGDTEHFVCADGAVLCYQGGRLQTLCKGQSSLIEVTGAAAYAQGILITTQGDTYEYHTSDHSLQRSTIVPSSRCQILRDEKGNALFWTPNGDHILYVRARDLLVFPATLSAAGNSQAPVQQLDMTTTQQGEVFIATFGRGLYIFHPEENRMLHYTQQLGEDAFINSNYLLAVYQDRSGNIWVSQEDFGLSCLQRIVSKADFLSLPTNGSTDLHDNSVRMLRSWTGNTVYVGSFTNHLYSYDGHQLTSLPNPWGSILATAKGPEGALWLGTRAGLVIDGRLHSHDRTDGNSLSSNKISDICADSMGHMWIAAFDGGLDLAMPTADGRWRFRHFLNDNTQQREARVLCLDHHGRLWLGTGEGCYVFDPERLVKDERAYWHLSTKRNSKMDEIHAICEDRRHQVWVAITGLGVARYDNSGDKPRLVRFYTVSDGLGDMAVQSIVEDRQGRIYIGTNRGLSVFNEESEQFQNYLLSSSQLGNVYMENAACRLSDGRVAFGTKDGLMTLSPTQLSASHENTFLAITDILVNGVPISEVSPQDDAADRAETITLAHDQNSLTFHFSDFSFDNSESSQYTYKLEGYDRDWQPLTHSSVATYRNLSPGRYTLLLRSCNNEGVWSGQTKELAIRIRPPFWATWYAYLFYLLLAAVITWLIYRQLRHINELRNRIKVEQQLAEFKVQFFTGISHEFRTPLTIIQGAMERIRDAGNIPGNLKQPVGNMQKSVKRMSRLISRLMDFRKIQENRMTLAVEQTDVVSFLRDIWTTFRDLADNKRINLQFATFASSYLMPVDLRKLDSIAYNLISNALKYTPAGGSVVMRLALNQETRQFLLEVTDSGIGISPERQQQLFQRFQQSSPDHDSVGIGLNLSYRLALLHKGALTFRENPEGGSIFTLTLPADSTAYTEEDYAKELGSTILADDQQATPEADQRPKNDTWLENYKEVAGPPLNDRTLLIVEDDDDVREYLVSELRSYFEVIETTNGSEAWEQIHEQRPDIILSDVAMPLMNGFELTQRIKKDKTLSDIPVVLLTAFTDDVKRERGFSVGADDYIQKPFSVRTLVARLSQLLQQRDKLRNAYSTIEAAPVVAVVKDERDKKFIASLDAWIYNHMGSNTLNVDELAEKLGFGRSSFYRKVNALTGMTPNNYIRRIRMEESKKMLEETNLTVSEIAYKTGFSNAFYFSKCFKEYYGMPPSRFRNGEK